MEVQKMNDTKFNINTRKFKKNFSFNKTASIVAVLMATCAQTESYASSALSFSNLCPMPESDGKIYVNSLNTSISGTIVEPNTSHKIDDFKIYGGDGTKVPSDKDGISVLSSNTSPSNLSGAANGTNLDFSFTLGTISIAIKNDEVGTFNIKASDDATSNSLTSDNETPFQQIVYSTIAPTIPAIGLINPKRDNDVIIGLAPVKATTSTQNGPYSATIVNASSVAKVPLKKAKIFDLFGAFIGYAVLKNDTTVTIPESLNFSSGQSYKLKVWDAALNSSDQNFAVMQTTDFTIKTPLFGYANSVLSNGLTTDFTLGSVNGTSVAIDTAKLKDSFGSIFPLASSCISGGRVSINSSNLVINSVPLPDDKYDLLVTDQNGDTLTQSFILNNVAPIIKSAVKPNNDGIIYIGANELSMAWNILTANFEGEVIPLKSLHIIGKDVGLNTFNDDLMPYVQPPVVNRYSLNLDLATKYPTMLQGGDFTFQIMDGCSNLTLQKVIVSASSPVIG